MESNNKKKEILNKNKIEIFNFLDRVKLVAIVLILVVILFVYFFIYNVMVEEARISQVDKFVEAGNLNYYMIKYSIDRAEEGAMSLSSRTMIREASKEYLDGERSLEELKTYTQDKYIDGVEALDNIIYAERVVGGESIAKYNIADFPIPKYSLDEIISKETLSTDIKETESLVEIYSPIIGDSGVIGHDYLVYTIKNELDSLSRDEVKVGLICDKAHIALLANSRVLEAEYDRSILETKEDFYVFYELGDKYLYTKTSKSDLFEDLDKIINGITITSILVLVFVSLSIYIFIIRYAHNKISDLDESREEFKNLAYIDQVTGAYSRSFLEDWDKNYRQEDKSYSLIMVDVNDFKDINDIYGHARGDLVLNRIARSLLDNSRDSDIVARFGGDEFVVILPSANTKQAEKFMERVEEEIYSMEDLSLPVTISFGISSFTGESYERALEKADELMYRDKKRKMSLDDN